MSEQTTKTASDLRTEIDTTILDFAAIAKKNISIDEVGAMTINKEFITEALESQELNEADMVKYQDFSTNLAAGLQLAGGEASIDYFSANAGVDVVSGGTKLGRMDLDFDGKRTKEIRNVKTGETTTRYGAATASIVYRKQQTKARVKRVSAFLSQLGEETLA